MATVKDTLAAYARRTEAYLAGCLRGKGAPEGLLAAMEYSLLAGGKRMRPALCLAWAELGGLAGDAALPAAAALELVHTYSLVHDDLPAMDNDDLRRGRPTNHKVFGEAAAILAGDGLLTEAFSLILDNPGGLPPERVLRAAAVLARGAGPSGMVGGQAVDMELTGKTGVALPELRAMHAMKTGALITAACQAGAALSGAGEGFAARAEGYGRAVGVAFQIADDILDVVGDEKTIGKPVGSDQRQGKVTYVSLAGLDESRRLAHVAADEALEHLASLDGPPAGFLRDLARYIVERVN
ncbi:MAG: polyprenyl synthetase family protein [Thermodesulfobacteriota bacterium]